MIMVDLAWNSVAMGWAHNLFRILILKHAGGSI